MPSRSTCGPRTASSSRRSASTGASVDNRARSWWTATSVTHAQGPAVEIGDGKARVETDGARVEFELAAPTAAAPANAAGLRRSAQLCEVEGTVVRDGRSAAAARPAPSRFARGPTISPRGAAAIRDRGHRRRRPASPASRCSRRPPPRTATSSWRDRSPTRRATTAPRPSRTCGSRRSTGRTACREAPAPSSTGPATSSPSRLAGQALSGSVLELGGTGIAISFFSVDAGGPARMGHLRDRAVTLTARRARRHPRGDLRLRRCPDEQADGCVRGVPGRDGNLDGPARARHAAGRRARRRVSVVPARAR